MKYLKILGCTIAADILSLFIGLTLASSSQTFIRFISSVCTAGILICIIASFSIKSAREDLKNCRINNTKINPAFQITIGLTASLPSIVSYITLYISRSTGSFDFYKWHKLINGYFLQIYNFINSDASTSALSNSDLLIMLPLLLIPFLSYIVPYLLICKGIIPESEK